MVVCLTPFLPILLHKHRCRINNHPGLILQSLLCGQADTGLCDIKAAACPVTVIGEIVADKTGEITLVDKKGKPFNLGKTGWEHFAPR